MQCTHNFSILNGIKIIYTKISNQHSLATCKISLLYKKTCKKYELRRKAQNHTGHINWVATCNEKEVL